MLNHKTLLLFLVIPFLLSINIKQQPEQNEIVAGNWNGTVTWTKTSASKGRRIWDSNGKECAYRWNFSFEFKITVNFRNGKGTVVRLDKTSNWEKDSTIFIHPDNKYMIEERTKMIDCSGQDVSELSVEFSEDKKHYWISFYTPECRGQITYDVRNNIHGNSSNPSVNEQQGGQITLPANFTGQPVGNNPDVLSGTFTETIPAPNDEGGGEIITTATWNLTRGASKPELIVTPYSEDADYDNWMPEPGTSELVKGNDLNIELHLQDIGGGSSTVKAKSFELRLINTSKQPGICLNAPLAPSAPKHDIRFLPQDGATISPDGQFIKIPCDDGENGEVVIGSFDGGGWTILNAEAILENNTRIKGVLMQDKSKKDIPVPKNNAGGKIAQRWLDDNGNPGEMDDEETSPGNSNNGDGLSAYEEYRGFVSEGRYKRLDPSTKELGVKIKKTDIPIFSDGLQKFENATGFKIVRFYENEIPTNRRINQNGTYANIYKQFALNLETGSLPAKQIAKAFGSPGIPSVVDPVRFNLAGIHQAYLDNQAEARNMNTTLPYTENEFIAHIVAHELAHGVNAAHHGSIDPVDLATNTIDTNLIPRPSPFVRVFRYNGTEFTYPCVIGGTTGVPGNAESGDLSCIMAEITLCSWVAHESPTVTNFFEIPVIPLGNRLCTSSSGTGINAGGKYFGDATRGKCVEQLKLK
jgi:predicted SprT family Zn-dependent metalloprotease